MGKCTTYRKIKRLTNIFQTLKKRIRLITNKNYKTMEMKGMTLVEFAERFSAGEFASKDINTQIDAGWYDWFCSDGALATKTEYLGKKVLSILDSKKFNKTKSYVFFKNNCPVVGKLYDQFSICDIETGDVFCCQHLEKGSHGWDKAHWEIYSKEAGFEKPVVQGTWRECMKWFIKE